MANFGKLFQEEVRRLARKEAKGDIDRLRKESVELRRLLGNLKKRVAVLEKRRTAAAPADAAAPEEEAGAAAERVRVSSSTVKKLRQKLGLTQVEFATLLGVSGQSVYQWERQNGRLQLRRATRRAFFEIRTLGVREARARLQELDK